jgi:hypothetical protein
MKPTIVIFMFISQSKKNNFDKIQKTIHLYRGSNTRINVLQNIKISYTLLSYLLRATTMFK